MTRPRPRGDAGTVLVLTLGFAVVALLLVAVVVDASKLFLTRRALAGAADAAALAGAQGLDVAAVYAGRAGDGQAPLDPAAVGTAVDSYLRAAGVGATFTDLRVEAVTSDGATVTVTLSARAVLPLYSTVTAAPDGVPIIVTARARSAVLG